MLLQIKVPLLFLAVAFAILGVIAHVLKSPHDQFCLSAAVAFGVCAIAAPGGG